MIRFLATLAGVVAVVWVLSFFAAPPVPEVEGNDITPFDARLPSLAGSPGRVGEATAAHEEQQPEKEEGPAKHAPGKKGKGKGHGKRGRW